MARRRTSAVGDFLTNFNAAYGLTRQIGSDIDADRVLKEQPTTELEFQPPADPGAVGPAAPTDINATGAMRVAPQPRATTTFMGRKFDGALDDDQVMEARMGAMADVVGRTDPARAMQMHSQVASLRQGRAREARETTRFGWEKDRVAREEAAAKRKDESDALFRTSLAEYTGAPEQITPTIQHLNGNSARITVGEPDKNGLVQISVVRGDKGADFATLSRAQQAQLYAGAKLMDTDPERALQLIGGVNKSLAEAVAAENGLKTKLAENTNDVADKREGRAIQRLTADTARLNSDEARRHNREMEGIAATRASNAAGAGGRGSGAMWDQAVAIAKEGHFGGSPERAYEGLKRGSVRNSVQDDARKLELELRKNNAPDAEVRSQVASYLQGQGLPSAGALSELRAGKRADGKPFTREDYAAWDQTFPNMTVEDVLGSVPDAPPAAAPAPAPRGGLPPRMVPAPAARAAPTTGQLHTGAYDTPYARRLAEEAAAKPQPAPGLRLLPNGRPNLAPAY